MSVVLSSLTVALAGPTFLPLPEPSALFPPPFPCLPLGSICCLHPSSLASPVPQNPPTVPMPRLPLAPLPPPLSAPSPLSFNFSVSPSLHTVHFSSVFCPRGKARLCAASCLTLLHLRSPSGPLVGGGVEPVETVSCPHAQAGGTSPDPGLQRGASVFLPWASFSLKACGG